MEFPDYEMPDLCPQCGHELEWDWYEDPEGRPPMYFTVKPDYWITARPYGQNMKGKLKPQ